MRVMAGPSIERTRGFSVLGTTAKNGRVVKPVRSRKDDEDDGELPKRRPPPRPGTGELLDKEI